MQYYRTAGSVEVSKSQDWRDFSVDYVEYNPFYRTTHVHAARFTAKSTDTDPDWGSGAISAKLSEASNMPPSFPFFVVLTALGVLRMLPVLKGVGDAYGF